MTQGVLIGADQHAEELIPWWWSCYSRHCSLPVAIVDFGMSHKRRLWCQKRMQVIPLIDAISVTPKASVTSVHRKLWKRQYRGPLWQAREAWFKKPTACRLSPFEVTLWLDLDCEVCAPLDDLFLAFEKEIDLAIALQDTSLDAPPVYNSGVLLFRQGSAFLKEWDLECHLHNEVMMGDQDVLTQILLAGRAPFKVLSPYYNWLMYRGVEPGIAIAHWAAGWGKEYILKYGGLCCSLTKQQSKND
jgi:hypothetical protein